MTMLDDYHPVVMAPAFVPAEVPMFAELGPRAEPVMVTAAFDHDVFSARNRWRRDGDHAECCKNVSKLLHVFSSSEWD
jgi:hypothetical protein